MIRDGLVRRKAAQVTGPGLTRKGNFIASIQTHSWWEIEEKTSKTIYFQLVALTIMILELLIAVKE